MTRPLGILGRGGQPRTWRDDARDAADKGDPAMLVGAIERLIGSGEPLPKGVAQRLMSAWRASGRGLND